MGTNYYVRFDACPHCGHSEDEYHIGKSSGGWCFSLHVDPDKGITTLGEVMDIADKGKIYNEYGEIITPDEMYAIITKRYWEREREKQHSWYEQNRALDGPNGLVRHVIDGARCIGHGEGTWDYITGEFS